MKDRRGGRASEKRKKKDLCVWEVTQKGHRDMEGEKWKRGSGEKTYKARDWDIVRPTLGGAQINGYFSAFTTALVT